MSAVGADIVMTLGLEPGDAGVSAMSPAVTVTISKSDPRKDSKLSIKRNSELNVCNDSKLWIGGVKGHLSLRVL